jgi:predicted AlkP superfamily phosphohydrolase/phosphomutase
MMKKVIVIGLDGFEPTLVDRLLERKELPNLARLRAQGGYARVRTTYPAQTPVAWSTFATGTNPGGHGVFDFIRRDPKTYLPELSFTRYEQKNLFLPPKAVNLRRGVPLWQLLTQAGLPSTVVRFPCAYPPESIYGRMLAGMGVPDLRGGQGTSTFYTSDHDVEAQESENVVPVRLHGDTIWTHLIGPRDPKTGADFRCEITLYLEPASRSLSLVFDGQPGSLTIKEGEWSDWLRVKFKTGLLQAARGMARFYLAQMGPVFELYASPINFDADAPLFPISSPPEYAKELAARIGTFYTTGMVEDHNGLNNGRISEAAFLAQCDDALNERARMMAYELERFDRGFFFCLFDTPDRVQHMFRRGGERVVEEHYRKCDAIVGSAMEYVDDSTLLVILSDHGMNSFERGFNLNTWLYDRELLTLKRGFAPGEEAGDLLRAVDWERTRAYALGLSGIYLNLKGREERGVVEAGEAEKLKAAIAQSLAGLGDPERGRVAIRSVVTREQVFSGAYAAESPDLLVNYAGGYRVSWATSLGGVPERQFEDNVKKWSGDHLIDPQLVPGALFMNWPFDGHRASLADMAPTILEALGLPKGEAMEGGSLLQ